MAKALKDQTVHEKCFNSPDISKSDSCCLHINLSASAEQYIVLIGEAVWFRMKSPECCTLKKKKTHPPIVCFSERKTGGVTERTV